MSVVERSDVTSPCRMEGRSVILSSSERLRCWVASVPVALSRYSQTKRGIRRIAWARRSERAGYLASRDIAVLVPFAVQLSRGESGPKHCGMGLGWSLRGIFQLAAEHSLNILFNSYLRRAIFPP